MLQEFTVDNYKSLINLTFRPREQNLLIGVNNSGKTNLCQAMRLVSQTALSKLDDCAIWLAGGPTGITNHYLAKKTVDFRLRAAMPYGEEDLSYDYSLSISVGKTSQLPVLEVETEKLIVTGSRFDGTVLIDNNCGEVSYLNEQKHLDGNPEYHRAAIPRTQTMLSQVLHDRTFAVASRFRDFLSSWHYYALSADALRGTAHRLNDHVLKSDGANLASVVYHLKTSNERAYRWLLSHLRKLDPAIDLINFSIPRVDAAFMFFEDSHGNAVPVSSASSGTLRFLALLYVLTVQPFIAAAPLVIIEEPENGIYVGFLKKVLGLLEETQNRPQLIFTSHSPYFIDLFDSRLDSIFVMKPGEQHSSITQPDEAQVKKRLEKYPLGEQHFREMLG